VSQGRGPLRSLARSGVLAGVIKLGSAGLSFLMFLAVALVTDERQFGLYGAAYAGASLASFFNTLGQQSAVIRFWPEYASAGAYNTAHAFVARSLLVAIGGAILSAIIVSAIAFIPWFHDDTPEWMPLVLGSALLATALGWSEVASAAVRAKGSVISGLLPRDIIWRSLLIGTLGLLWVFKIDLTAAEAVLYTAVLLIASVLPQAIDLVRSTLLAKRDPLTPAQVAEFNKVTQGLWGITAVPPALGQVSTLMIAGILGPEIAGAVFVAERTTRLINVALNGINQALAPEISGGFHRGDVRFVGRLSHLTALGASAAALLVFVIFWFFGMEILAIFEATYATPTIHATLLIFCLGTMVTCASGPVEILMQVTGMQHRLLRILMIVQPIGLVATAVLTYAFGPIGAAGGISATLTTWVILAVVSIKRDLKVDPTLFGFMRELRART